MGKWQAWPSNSLTSAPAVAQIKTMLGQFNNAYQGLFNQAPEAETQTRFLCGMASPWLTKVKAKKIANYGRLEQVPYEAVLRVTS